MQVFILPHLLRTPRAQFTCFTGTEVQTLTQLEVHTHITQSFCHTAAYPKPVDVVTHATLPDFIRNRGGVSLRPGDGIIHSWLNRMLLPDTVGTGGASLYTYYILIIYSYIYIYLYYMYLYIYVSI